jgi:twitching motility protein PilT
MRPRGHRSRQLSCRGTCAVVEVRGASLVRPRTVPCNTEPVAMDPTDPRNQQASTPMPDVPAQFPRVNVENLTTALQARGWYDESSLISLLGEARNRLTLAELERAVVRDVRVSAANLAELKSAVSGYPAVRMGVARALPALPADLSKSTGAVALEAPTPTVAMVEDLPASVAAVEKHLGAAFRIEVCTLEQFVALHRSCYEEEVIEFLPEVEDIYAVFDEAVRRRASDVHLSVGAPPFLRVDGILEPVRAEPLDIEWMRSEIARIAGVERLVELEKTQQLDLAFPYGSTRFRVNFGADQRGLTVAARKIPTKIPTPEELGLPPAAQELVHLERGLVLVTGPTGSGKSTTLAALLSTITTRQSKHIITLEDPIEFHLPTGRSVVHQRELGHSFTGFADGLRQALRQDPDVVLVGEMRDIETIRTALTAAETGHLVFGTLHTFDCASTVSRVVSAFPAEEQEQIRGMLSYILKATVSQTLLRSIAGPGRVAAFEVMIANAAIQNNLRKLDGQAQLRQTIETSAREGMQTMDMALADLVRRRQVSKEDALEKVVNREDFLKRLAT